MLGTAANRGWRIKQMDITTAFLNGIILEELYMLQPEGLDDGSGSVCKLKKAIYGLKQAPRAWYHKLEETLLAGGFKKSECDHSLFLLQEKEQFLMLLVYVDDILLFSESSTMIERVEEMLEMQFKCSNMGDVKYYLGMHVERDLDKGVLRLHQRKYCEGLAEKYGLQDGGKPATPLPSGFTVEPCADEEVVGESDRKLFHSMVGALNYAANHTRPDIGFATSKLASVVSHPSHEQLEAAKRLVRYVNATASMGLEYSAVRQRQQRGAADLGKGEMLLTCYTDVSFNSVKADGTSIGGYVCVFGGGAVSWRSKKQNEVGLSSCETEYMALHHGVKEAAALGAGETAALGASAYAAPGAGESAPSGTASAQVLHTFTLDSGASRSFFRDRTTLTPLSRPVAVSLADPSGGPVLASFSTVLPCPAAPSGSLSGLYLPSFSKNLVSGADLQDQGVDQFTPASQRVTHCTCARTGRHLATFTRRPGSSLYTLSTESPPVSASGQVAASSQVLAAASGSGPESAPCSCRLLSHQTLLWHHRLGHPSLPRLRGMASRVLVSGLPRSLPPIPPGPAHTCVPCVEGRQRAAPHSSEFPPTEAPLQTLHMDVWGPARVRGQAHERYFLLVVDEYSRYTTVFPLRSKGDVTEVLIDWIRAARLRLRESFGSDFPVLRLHSDRGREFSSALLGAFCRAQGIRQTFTLPASPQQNGIAERRIGMVMDVARTSMIHAAAPHFLWPFAVQYAAHQLNLQPRVSLPETSPTLLWTGKVGDASAFRVWGSRAFVRDLSADKLSPRAVPCVFLGFPTDAPSWRFYHPTSRRVLSSQDVTFDESVPYYRLFPYRTASLPPPPLFLAPGPPPVDPLPPQGPAPSGVSQVDAVEPVEVAVDSGAATGAEPAGAGTGGAGSGGAETRGAEPGGAETGEHMAAAKRVLRYLCSTSGMGLVLGGRRPVVLTGHADASWADDQATQRSSQGYTFSLGSGSVSWRSTRSSSVLSSSCEAEIYAGAMAAQELRWLTYLLNDLGEQPRSPPVLYVDNKAMLALCREHRLEHRTKHIALRYFLARELQQRGQLRLAYVASEANTADIFTKALAPGDHQRFCTMLGLVPTWPHLLTS
ncbi:unnamed protein product [Closterium sp. NIES-53]